MLKIAAILIIAVILLYLLGSLFVKNKTKFKFKPALITLILGIGLLIASNTFFNSDKSVVANAPEYIQKAPTIQQAAYAIQTTSRLYYVSHYTDDGKVVSLTDYYIFNSNKWEHQVKTLLLDREVYKFLKIYNR